ncbi:MAG TPA: efflux RND transporter periplasmic adaptor subunit [Gemmatimonadaceae bacterium]|nr:efflux RND transporter periplasmic adaptor subunit [Gemmatimonadaceae bacterium]
MNRQVLALSAFVLFAGACKEEVASTPVDTAPVERRDIIVDAEATGVVEPINVIEVKSKASGLITQMSVETGDDVRPGDLLVQVDTRDVRNQHDQASADLRAAEARGEVVAAQRKRSDDLYAQRIITAQEYEAAQLEYANAQAQLVRSRASLDLAQQRLEDATVRAPVVGTIIEKTVSVGQVITSATGAFGGGTTLLKMADLSKVRVRALVNETDIGSVRAGLPATVVVDAYPDRPFRGTVEKIEPQAVVQQSVTMFPVLVSIDNVEGLLKPGMNGEVSVLIDRRDMVVAVPNDAVRSVREAGIAAAALGLDPEWVAARLRAAASGAGASPAGNSTVPVGGTPVVRAQAQGNADLSLVQAQFQNRPGGGAQRGDARPQVRTGAPDPAGNAPLPRNRTRAGLVFVADSGTFVPRMVRLGASNYDYTEVVSGLAEGERVALLASATLQRRRQENVERIQRMTGGGVPGMSRQEPQGGAAGGAGANRGSARP